MSAIQLGVTGPFSRPEMIVAATRGLDRGRTPAKEVDALYATWTRRVLQLETAQGFATVTGGNLAAQDLFRPLAESSRGVEVGPLTRNFESNTFFRQPIVHQAPQAEPGALLARLPLDLLRESRRPVRVILPGPYTLAGVSDNRSGLGAPALAKAWAQRIAAEVPGLVKAGVRAFQFQEPLLAVDPPEADEEAWVVDAYRALAPALEGRESLVWTYFGDGGPIFPLLAKLPVGGVGVDLADTDPGLLTEFPSDKVLGLGCLDSRSSLPEDPKVLAKVVGELDRRLSPSGILLGPGLPLDLLPWEPAVAKLEVLTSTVRLLGEGLPAPAKKGAPAAKGPAPKASAGKPARRRA